MRRRMASAGNACLPSLGDVGLGVQQDVDQARPRLGEPVQMQGAGDGLQLQLVLERLGELAQRIVLALGHHERDLWHRRRSYRPSRRVGRQPGSLSLVDSDLASTKNGISERFVPEQDQGRLIEVEHVSRYQWAAQAANGRAVLDAGCGTGYGCRLLAAGGAREVIGVDIARSVLEAVAPAMPESVRLQAGDVRKLDFARRQLRVGRLLRGDRARGGSLRRARRARPCAGSRADCCWSLRPIAASIRPGIRTISTSSHPLSSRRS